jgi:hypothetical protein
LIRLDPVTLVPEAKIRKLALLCLGKGTGL